MIPLFFRPSVPRRSRTMPSRTLFWAGLAVVFLLGGCAYQGAKTPPERKLSWHDYAGGGDLKRTCTASAEDHYRLIYNGVYTQQVRAYDLIPNRAGGATLTAHVVQEPDLSAWVVSSFQDLFAPWNGTKTTSTISAEQWRQFQVAARTSGVFDPPPVGLRLPSHHFYWLVSSCVAGTYRLTAMSWPSRQFDQAAFAPLLVAWDRTGIALAPPRRLTLESANPHRSARDSKYAFTYQVGPSGLLYQPSPIGADGG